MESHLGTGPRTRHAVTFLVNGAPGSAAGIRAARVAGALGATPYRIVYRQAGRAADLPRFALAGVSASLVYAMDLAVVPTLAALLPSLQAPVVVDTGDAPVAFHELFGAGRVRQRAARWLEEIGYGIADHIIVRGAHHAPELAARGYGPVSIIPDGVDLDVFRPVPDPGLRSRLGLDGVLTVGVQANFTWNAAVGGGPGWELITAMGLRPELPVHAVLIGDGHGLAELMALARRLGVAGRVLAVGHQPYDELPRYLGVCDACLLTQSNEPASWVRTTGKLPCYLATGRYILASRVGTAADLLPEEMLLDYEGTWDLDYPAKLAHRLAELAQDPDRLARGLELRALAERFDYRKVAAEAARIVTDLLAAHP